MGSTLPTTNPPSRVDDEYAMIDCTSGRRLVAGMPLGTPMDASSVYRIPPIEQRERCHEAHDRVIKAWSGRVGPSRQPGSQRLRRGARPTPRGRRVEVLENGAHLPHPEQTERTLPVTEFLDAR
jgi:hypothetical protein